MSLADEAAVARGQFASGLALGLETISQNQEITFTRYERLILPIDGFAFWVKADLIAPNARVGSSGFNTFAFNQPAQVKLPATTVKVKGSLHYSTENQQSEDEGFAVNRVIFTSEQDIDELNVAGPTVIYIGEFDGLRFAFSSRSLYRQADLWHYRGDAVYPALANQLIDKLDGFDAQNKVISNSLPIWLTLNKFFPMYPSFLVPDNIVPAWCSVHIGEESTLAIQPVPYLDNQGSHFQLCQDNVRLTFYGTRNFNILSFMDYVNQFSLDTDQFGIMNMPVIRDAKRTQTETTLIAMKKIADFEISYYQEAARDLALQYIKSVFVTYYNG
jgi:hypothetical protein